MGGKTKQQITDLCITSIRYLWSFNKQSKGYALHLMKHKYLKDCNVHFIFEFTVTTRYRHLADICMHNRFSQDTPLFKHIKTSHFTSQ